MAVPGGMNDVARGNLRNAVADAQETVVQDAHVGVDLAGLRFRSATSLERALRSWAPSTGYISSQFQSQSTKSQQSNEVQSIAKVVSNHINVL